MAVDAYAIGMSMVLDQSKVVGPLAEMFKGLEKVQRSLRDTQAGINDMVASLRGAARVTASLASAMERVAAAAGKAARAGAGGVAGAARMGGGGGNTIADRAAPMSSGGALVPYVAGGALVPYASSATRGVPQGRPYTPYGTYGTTPRRREGGVIVPYQDQEPAGGRGFTMGPDATFNGGEGPVVPYGGPMRDGPIPLNYRAPWRPRLPSRSAIHSRATSAIGEFVLPDIIGYEALKSIAEPTVEAESIAAQMRAARFSEAQIARAKQLAYGMVRSVPGQSYVEGLDLINQTASFTGNVDEALALTTGLARNARVLSLYGKGNAIAQVEAAVKAGELTGLTNKDGTMNIPKLVEFVTRLTGTVVSGGGTLNIAKYLTGIRQFGVGADAATMDFTTAVLPAYMKIMGEARAGTALASFQQSLSAPPPRTQARGIIAEQKRLGIRDAHGNLVNGELLRSNPQAYIATELLPKIAATGAITPEAIQAELSRLLPRQTMIRLAASGIFDAAVINKEADRNRAQQQAQADAEKAGKAGPLDTLLNDSPANQMKAFTAALDLFKTKLGDAALKPAIGLLNDLTGVLQKMADWAAKNPDGAKTALEGMALGIAAFGIGTAAAAALALLTGPAGFVVLASGIVALGAAMPKIQPLLDFAAGATVGAAAGAAVAGAGGAVVGGVVGGTAGAVAGAIARHGSIPAAPMMDPYSIPTPDSPASIQKQSYAPTSKGKPVVVQNIMYLDGEPVYRSVTRHMDRDSRSAAQQGMTGFDSSETPWHSGLVTA